MVYSLHERKNQKKKPKDISKFRKVIRDTDNLFIAYSYNKLYNESEYFFLIIFEECGYWLEFSEKSKKDTFLRKIKEKTDDEAIKWFKSFEIIKWDKKLGDYIVFN